MASVRIGIRLRLLLALGAVLIVSLFPLFFAVARLTQASMANLRETSARELGRTVSGYVGLAAGSGRDLEPLLEAQLGEGGVVALSVHDEQGRRVASAGEAAELGELPSIIDHPAETSRSLVTPRGNRLRVVLPTGQVSVAVLLSTDLTFSPASSVVRLVALYMAIVALALVFLTHVVTTRIVVRPIQELSRAASRVAGGANRSLEVPPSGAAELDELGESLRTMTHRLRSDGESLRAKVIELEALTKELAEAQESIVRTERLASVGRLAAGVAHEIGNPIAAILGLEDILLVDDLPKEEARDLVLRMKTETERIHRILRDLLDFARPGAVATKEALAADIHAVASRVRSLVVPQRSARDVAIELELSPTPEIAIAEHRLEQVLLNLVLNAVEAARGEDGRVWIRASREGESVIIEVEDNGTGISDEVRERLFEPFVTTKEVGHGTGLGLAVCRGLITEVGGTIVGTNRPEGGARFTITLPVVATPDSGPGSGPG